GLTVNSEAARYESLLTQEILRSLAFAIREALNIDPSPQILTAMVLSCHQNAVETAGQPASPDELLYFTATKARILSLSPNIRNHMAVLRKAVPECFLGES